jgi:hypothetical protein
VEEETEASNGHGQWNHCRHGSHGSANGNSMALWLVVEAGSVAGLGFGREHREHTGTLQIQSMYSMY